MKAHNEFSAPEERQAIDVLSGISEVAAEIGALTRRFDAATRANDRATTASALLARLDRLANLEVLERMHLNNNLGEHCTELVKKGLFDANTCLTCSAIKLILDRAGTVRDRALAIVADDRECTLGLSRHLAEMVDDIDTVVEALGYGATPEGMDLGVIEEARRAVTDLARVEQRVLVLPEFT